LRVAAAEDLAPDPHVFETELTASVTSLEILEGLLTDVYAYNGTVPGPEIRVARGDRVIVHFTNDLPEPTTIHWHGVRVPNDVDGVPGVSQPEILPGETFTYDFVVPDAGTFWYHPHVRSAEQVGAGLYGSFVVTDPDEPKDLGDDVTLVLSDIDLRDDGQLETEILGGYLQLLFGREGNTLLVNGKVDPKLLARSGRRQRWRVINAARTRYYQLAIEGHEFLRFGGDGGMIEHPVTNETIVVAPAERAEVIFTPDAEPGTTLPVRWVPYDRGFGSTVRDEVEVMNIEVGDQGRYVDAPLPSLGRSIEALDISAAKELTMELTQNDPEDGTLALGINGIPSWDAPPIQVGLGETQVWTFRNTIDFAHPMHLHGYFFQVLSMDGTPPSVREWKDTVDVHVDGETKIAVHFDERPGMWMLHCHILDHSESGMMTMVDVSDGTEHGADDPMH
jgi:FtsP/CotA-like multicopper oxidase with cupredoxin domain